ncbi:MAG: hypothetical protein A4E44_01610 [Methanosaeta sp. PtaB.Bin018]|nr:MAG: hypothetical protein A4E44_01610 [Methanosaeta sp. PtaB.Bin018]OPY46981.1 MAG: hypothetical protein A4E46_00699 [Methanosaeta sp. PtaU1.Bin016]
MGVPHHGVLGLMLSFAIGFMPRPAPDEHSRALNLRHTTPFKACISCPFSFSLVLFRMLPRRQHLSGPWKFRRHPRRMSLSNSLALRAKPNCVVSSTQRKTRQTTYLFVMIIYSLRSTARLSVSYSIFRLQGVELAGDGWQVKRLGKRFSRGCWWISSRDSLKEHQPHSSFISQGTPAQLPLDTPGP